MEEGARILELAKCHNSEVERVLISERNFFRSVIVEISIISDQPSESLKRVVSNSDVVEVFFHTLADAS